MLSRRSGKYGFIIDDISKYRRVTGNLWCHSECDPIASIPRRAYYSRPEDRIRLHRRWSFAHYHFRCNIFKRRNGYRVTIGTRLVSCQTTRTHLASDDTLCGILFLSTHEAASCKITWINIIRDTSSGIG